MNPAIKRETFGFATELVASRLCVKFQSHSTRFLLSFKLMGLLPSYLASM